MIDWVLVRQAAAIEPTNALAAELLLKQAMGCDTEKPGCGGCEPGCCGGNVTLVEKPTTEQAVIYGKGGFTGPGDPRTLACQKHQTDNSGKPIAVHTAVLVQPSTRYRCTLVDLIPGDQSCQIYIEVYDRAGNAASKAGTRQLTGWSESTSYDALLDAPASPGHLPMGRGSKFWPPALGGSGACIVDGAGNIDSDIVGSLGLPAGEHVSYRVAFRER